MHEFPLGAPRIGDIRSIAAGNPPRDGVVVIDDSIEAQTLESMPEGKRSSISLFGRPLTMPAPPPMGQTANAEIQTADLVLRR